MRNTYTSSTKRYPPGKLTVHGLGYMKKADSSAGNWPNLRTLTFWIILSHNTPIGWNIYVPGESSIASETSTPWPQRTLLMLYARLVHVAKPGHSTTALGASRMNPPEAKGEKRRRGRANLGSKMPLGQTCLRITMDRRVTNSCFTHQSSPMLPNRLSPNVCSSEVPHISNTPSSLSRPPCSSWKVCKRAPLLTGPI